MQLPMQADRASDRPTDLPTNCVPCVLAAAAAASAPGVACLMLGQHATRGMQSVMQKASEAVALAVERPARSS